MRNGSSEFRLFFTTENRGLADMLPREANGNVSPAVHRVVGQPLRVCVKLESGRAPVPRSSELRPGLKKTRSLGAMLKNSAADFKGQAPGRGMTHGS